MKRKHMKVFLDFLKYNNAVPFLLFVIILSAGAAFASSPKLREAVFTPGETEPTDVLPKKTDVSQIAGKNFGAYDLKMRIDSITENKEAYFVAYSYQTFEVLDDAWREIRKTAKMEIPKTLLGKRDLGTYIVEQAEQVIGREVVYLSEVQASLTKKDREKSVDGQYASLVGSDVKAIPKKTIEPKEISPTRASTPSPIPAPALSQIISKEEINKMVVQAVSDFLAIDMSMPTDVPTNKSEGTVSENTPPAGEDMTSNKDDTINQEASPSEEETVVEENPKQ